MQKCVVLEKAHIIIKSDGHLRRQDAARRTYNIKYQLVIAVMEQKKKKKKKKKREKKKILIITD